MQSVCFRFEAGFPVRVPPELPRLRLVTRTKETSGPPGTEQGP